MKGEKGAITIWLTLMLVCILSFIGMVIEGIRMNNSYSICKEGLKLAAISCMANYEPDLYKEYHIYGLHNESRSVKDLEDCVYKYARASIDPNYHISRNGNKEMDILGLSINKIDIVHVEYMDNDNLINQICSYMKRKKKISTEIVTSTKEDIVTKKNYIYEYIMENCSSYKSLYIKGYMNKKYVYEQEYILFGKDKDNDNIEQAKKMLFNSMGETNKQNVNTIQDIKVIEDIQCSETEYANLIKKRLLKMDIDTLVNRLKEIIISNINRTYEKNIELDKLIVNVETKGTFMVEERATLNRLITNIINKNLKNRLLETTSEFGY